MSEYKFKTNINCGGCVATVTPYLEKIEGIKEWKVDTDDKKKVLTVDATEASENEVMEAVQAAGFEIAPMKKGLMGKFFSK